jgi:transposase-like protein
MSEVQSSKNTRRYSQEFKLSALKRLEAGEPASKLAVDLGVSRSVFHCWQVA